MDDDSILKCPICGAEQEPTDDENCDIGYAPHECQSCGKHFSISRTVTISYFAWVDEDNEKENAEIIQQCNGQINMFE